MVCLFSTLLLLFSPEITSGRPIYKEIDIENPFYNLLLQDRNFMYEGGCRIFSGPGEEPFISIVRACPVLCKNGGIRGFRLQNGHKALVTVMF